MSLPNSSAFTPVLALRVASFHIYERGKKYFELGKVEKIREDNNTTHAVVHGTRDYQVTLTFDDTNELVHDCTCPQESPSVCKHVVATILAYSDLPTSQPIKPNPTKRTNPIRDITLQQARSFLTKLTSQAPHLLDELSIFLQGSQETSKTMADYQQRFASELSQLDSLNLLESYHEDTWQCNYDDELSNPLAIWVEDVNSLIDSYTDNNNYGEAIKISTSALSALTSRGQELISIYSDLYDWVNESTDSLLWSLHRLIDDLPLKHLPTTITRLISLLNQKSTTSLHHILASHIAKMYQSLSDWEHLTDFVDQHLTFNPSISIPLLQHYQQEGNLDSIRTLGEQTLHLLHTQERELYQDLNSTYIPDKLETKIRRLLATVYSVESEYQVALANLQQLFLTSRDLHDYHPLRKAFSSQQAKEKFWSTMESEFLEKYDVRAVFEVYQLEKKDSRVLVLAKQHLDNECFASVIDYLKANHSQECFDMYQEKIDHLLIPAIPGKYANIATHLAHMRSIGLESKFDIYLASIRDQHKRRRRLLQEFTKKGL